MDGPEPYGFLLRIASSIGVIRSMGTGNTMPALLDAVRAYATIGEMCDVLREVWGEYQEQAII